MKVADVMQKKVDTVTPSSSLLDAAKHIFGKHHRGLPVVEGRGHTLVGFVTDQDILSLLFPTVSEFMEDYIHERDFESMEKRVKPALQKKVRDVMKKKIFTIREDEALMKAESLMKIHDISRLPVVDREKRLVGILSKGDIFRAIVGKNIASKLKK